MSASDYETRMNRNALELLSVLLDGESNLDEAALVAQFKLARAAVEDASTEAERAVGLLKLSPGPAGSDARAERFKRIVTALEADSGSFWDSPVNVL